MSLVGARPKGPRPDLKDGSQKILLTRLNELNNPYRVSYDMVARQLWPDQGPPKIHRSRTRDLSRQFRGEKAIEWRVVEIYVNLLFAEADPALTAELPVLRELHAQAFETTVDPDGAPAPAPAPAPEPKAAPIDPAYVAELERQLAEARTRASFATALLVIVQAENTALRGRGSSFDWFNQPSRSGGTAALASEAGSRSRTGRRATAGSATAASTADPAAGRPAGGRAKSTRSGTEASQPIDPATTPIRRQDYRSGQRRRSGLNKPSLADAFPPGVRTPAYPAVAPPAPSPALAAPAPARNRSASSSQRRAQTPDPVTDDSSLDVLVSHEKRRRGKNG
ncbi:hypothetical protein [Pseudofrankia sp. BMG5.37]|uniref:hypothetical protein n=1 Tax=Pseudofrankia sp. BMG5.37 TaxID=3050035 RepID=UPI002893B363|nr:hypothetical protein [Pseudofrankia sp. BMG5.37]MDT3443643.1 hypothetical protein [Pseudofrankia sp. BMG5.37]